MAWEDCKDSGPWAFTEQVNKPCYNLGSSIVCSDQAIWSMDPDSGVIITPGHDPCGYWTGVPATIPPSVGGDIFTVFTSNPYQAIEHLYFDGRELSFVKMYQPGGSLTGLTLHNGRLLTVAGSGASASVRSIEPGDFAVAEETFPFNQYDFSNATYGVLTENTDGTMFLVAPAEERFVKLSGMNRVGRGFVGTVVNGTDGHLYFARAYYASWNDPGQHRPVTGTYWHYVWERIEDDICDSPVVNWGEGIIYPCDNSGVYCVYHQGKPYFSYFSSPNSRLRIFDSNSFEIEETTNTTYSRRLMVVGGKIYAVHGIYSTVIKTYDKDTLDLEVTGPALASGRFGDMAMMGGNLIVINGEYTAGDQGGLYKINPGTLEVEEQLLFNDPFPYKNSYTRIHPLDDRYVVAKRGGGTSVFDVQRMRLVDDIDSAGNAAQPTDTVVLNYHATGGVGVPDTFWQDMTISVSCLEGENALAHSEFVTDSLGVELAYEVTEVNAHDYYTWVASPVVGGSGVGRLSITFNTSTLPAGNYAGHITVSTSSGSLTLSINLVVSSSDQYPLIQSGFMEYDIPVGSGEARYYKFVAGVTSCLLAPIQVSNTSRSPHIIHMLVKRGGPPTVADFNLTYGMAPSLYHCTLERWIPAKPGAENLYWQYSDTEFVEIGEPMGAYTFYIMLYNNGGQSSNTRLGLHYYD